MHAIIILPPLPQGNQGARDAMDDLEEGEVMEIEEQEQRKPEEEVLPTTASSSSLHMAETFLAEATRGMDTGFVPRVVLPGDEITELVSHSSSRVKIGKYRYSLS